MALKIYFAGPNVFHPHAKEMEHEIASYCESKGIIALIPGDSGIDWTNPDKRAIAQQIFAINKMHLDQCDGVIANVTPFRGACVDDGTAWEIGYAFALGKPVVSYGSGFLTTGEIIESVAGVNTNHSVPRRDRDSFLIEEFGFQSNLMIACSTLRHFHCSFDWYSNILEAISEPLDFLALELSTATRNE